MYRLTLLVPLLMACVDEDAGIHDPGAGGSGGILEEGDPEAIVEEPCLFDDDLDVPLTRSTEGAVLHWRVPGGCVTPYYHPDLVDRLPDIQLALDVWGGVECSQLCFAPPIEGQPEEGARALYFEPVAPGDVDVRVHVGHRLKSGRILQVPIEVSVPSDGIEDALDIQWAVGRAIGLDTPTKEGVESRMLTAGSATTPADEITVCLLYGDPPLCELLAAP